MTENPQKELELFRQIVSGLSSLDKDAQMRLIQSVLTFLKLDDIPKPSHWPETRSFASGSKEQAVPVHQFSETSQLSPKEFILEKGPRTDIERVACLAYYLTHYGNTAQFKTLDISKLNMGAAQPKLANAAQAVKNATNRSFLISVARGKKQLGAMGEQFVQALPDREAAKDIIEGMMSRRRKTVSRKKTNTRARRPKEDA
ncbi:hypothetical protein ACFLQR_03635 [Verrucomicrobiota bacterium]